MNGYTGGIGGTFINHWCTTPTANTGLIQAYPCVGCGNLSIDTVYQFIEVGGSAGNIIIQSIQLQGDGPNPFGLDNCTY
jgi:hypothetical protein